jgi:hypothetical protein
VFDPPPLIDVALPSASSAPGTARRAVRELLGDEPDATFTQDALLLTSEIVSNATVVSGASRLCAWFAAEDGALRVEVHDESHEMPVVPDARRPDQITGRGLRIVDAVATRWGIDCDAIGKSVWFEMHTHPPAA